MTDLCNYLQKLLYEEIPISQALQIKVTQWSDHTLKMTLPLQPNINHMSSAFGGSLYCGAVLGGWSWLHLRLREINILEGHIVIFGGEVSYPYPVLGDSKVICNAPDESAWEKFVVTLERYHKARLWLDSSVIYEDKEAVRFKGQYVVYFDR